VVAAPNKPFLGGVVDKIKSSSVSLVGKPIPVSYESPDVNKQLTVFDGVNLFLGQDVIHVGLFAFHGPSHKSDLTESGADTFITRIFRQEVGFYVNESHVFQVIGGGIAQIFNGDFVNNQLIGFKRKIKDFCFRDYHIGPLANVKGVAGKFGGLLHRVPLPSVDIDLNNNRYKEQSVQYIGGKELGVFVNYREGEIEVENKRKQDESAKGNQNYTSRRRFLPLVCGLAVISLSVFLIWHGLNLIWNKSERTIRSRK
jgi:hypothetical protein